MSARRSRAWWIVSSGPSGGWENLRAASTEAVHVARTAEPSLYLGCGPLHAWQVRVLFGMWRERHELIVFIHMHECIHTYNKLRGVDHCKHGIQYL